MRELAAWLTACLNEDEEVAQAATQGEWVWSREFVTPPGYHHRTVGPLEPGDAAFIARHDPARVLREIEAKRRILNEHRPGTPKGRPGMERHCLSCTTAQSWDEKAGESNCLTLRLLALPCADRPGYREEWRP